MNNEKPCRSTRDTDRIDLILRSSHPFQCANCNRFIADLPSRHMKLCAGRRVAEILST